MQIFYGKCYSYSIFSLDEPGETKSKYKAVECDPDVKFCAKLVNDNGVSGSEVYRYVVFNNLSVHCWI